MKKLALIIGLVALSSSLSFGKVKASSIVDTLGEESTHIVLTKSTKSLDIAFDQVDAAVQITIIEAEEGVVYSNFFTTPENNDHINYSDLPAGNYTVLVEYKNEVVRQDSFTIK